MAIDPDLQKLAQELAADPNTPAWEDAADLSRLHAQSFATKHLGKGFRGGGRGSASQDELGA